MLKSKAGQFLQFLRCEEFVKDNALRRQRRGTLRHRDLSV